MTVVLGVALALLFFALIMASIALHEIGHLVPAKLFGVKVTQYFVGFGKTLWSTTRAGTEYGFKVLPFGGYVKLIGMYPPKREGLKQTWLQRMADDARSYEHDSITPGDDGTLLYQKPVWQRVIVMLGGPLMNILLAFGIFLGLNLGYGTYQPTLQVASVSECIIPADRAEQVCRADDPVTPAVEAGVQTGDTVVSFNGTRVTEWTQLTDLIRANLDREATLVVERDGAEVTLPTVNTVVTGVADRLDPARTIEAGFLGMGPSSALVRGGVGTTAKQMWQMSRQSVVAIGAFPVKTWNVLVDMVTGQPRDANGPISVVGASRVAGELGVSDDISRSDKVATWFSLLGSINLFVALLNLVPLMPLDGGHIAGALWDGVRRAWATVRRRPLPPPVDTAKLLPIAYLVGGFLVLAGLVLIVADIFAPVSLF